MRTGIFVAPFGELSDVSALARIAAGAEASGWDGFFVWDHVMTHGRLAVADPWIALTAAALATERVRLGALVTPLSRRRPWDLARQVAVLDRLSNGRMVLGGGLGGDGRGEFSSFGEELDPRARARLLDEALELVVELWRGEPVDHEGAAFHLHGAQVLPTPAQQPRPPIWLACRYPNRRPLARAARYDGVFPIGKDGPLRGPEVEDVLGVIREHRPAGAGPFDVVITNHERPSADRASELAAAGTTWWLQGFSDHPVLEDVEAAALGGPPQWD